MKKITLIASLLLFTLFISPALADKQSILLRLPESVVVDVIQKCLPFSVSQKSDSLAGSITVTRIDSLVFKEQSLAAAVTMNGRDVKLNTSFGGHQIVLNVGSVDLNFDVSALVSFDRKAQTLYIRPTVSGLDQQGSQNNDVGKLIVALFNDQEIPLTLEKLQPIITDIGSTELIIDTVVNDVLLSPGSIDILLTPTTSAKKK